MKKSLVNEVRHVAIPDIMLTIVWQRFKLGTTHKSKAEKTSKSKHTPTVDSDIEDRDPKKAQKSGKRAHARQQEVDS